MVEIKKCLIVGSSGDIGSSILKAMLDLDYDITEVNRTGTFRYDEFFASKNTYDSVIISSGIMGLKPIKLLSINDLEDFMKVNFYLPAKIILHLIRNKLLNPDANIIVISSIAGQSAWTKGGTAYSASKAALNSFIKSTALELKQNRTINAICPGMVEGSNTKELSAQLTGSINKDRTKYPMGYISTDGIAQYASFLATYANKMKVNGTLVELDGGYNFYG